MPSCVYKTLVPSFFDEEENINKGTFAHGIELDETALDDCAFGAFFRIHFNHSRAVALIVERDSTQILIRYFNRT